MRIPILSHMTEMRQARRDVVLAEADFYRQKSQAITQMSKYQSEMISNLIESVSSPKMVLDDDLYGSKEKPYASQIWSNNSDFARSLSRKAYWSSAEAQAMLGRFSDMVYGSRLILQSMPLWDLIPGTTTDQEARAKLVKNIENRWKIWAKSKKVDYEMEMNHHQMSRQLFFDLMLDGEFFVILRYSGSRKRNPLSVQRIKPENLKRVSSLVATGNTETSGIEYNSKGQAVAYHIYDSGAGQSTRVLKFGPRTGRQMVIHSKLGGGRRGVGLLAGIITEITKLADFEALEIQASVVNAMFAIWVETAVGGEAKNFVPKNGIAGDPSYSSQSYKERPSISEFDAKYKTTEFGRGGVIAEGLGEGQKLNSFDTKRPTANFSDFFNTVLRNLFSAKGMHMGSALYDMNGSYSAARGELLVFWNRITTMRFDHICDYENIILQMWMWGEIDNGKVVAQGWEDETTREAWSNATWTGPSRPDIDPARSATAHEKESKNGWKTDNQITAERGGGDYDENIERKKTENDKKVIANTGLTILDKTSYSESKTESKSESITETKE